MQSPGKYHSIYFFFQTAILKENEKKLSDAQEELKQTKLKLNESSEKVAFLQSGEKGTMHERYTTLIDNTNFRLL